MKKTNYARRQAAGVRRAKEQKTPDKAQRMALKLFGPLRNMRHDASALTTYIVALSRDSDLSPKATHMSQEAHEAVQVAVEKYAALIQALKE
jgi:hypothetical protein